MSHYMNSRFFPLQIAPAACRPLRKIFTIYTHAAAAAVAIAVY
jgi:hypothetical protein